MKLKMLFLEYFQVKIFLHGLESSSKGAKAIFLRQRYPDMVIPDFSGCLFERMVSLHGILAGQKDIRLIGSSFGGLMASIFAMEKQGVVDRVVLLAPALNFPEFLQYPIRRLNIPAWMIIGKRDTVTPPAKVVPAARKIFTNLHYDEVNDDHQLARTFRNLDWETMLAD